MQLEEKERQQQEAEARAARLEATGRHAPAPKSFTIETTTFD